MLNDQEYALISRKILKLLGIDLSLYKSQQMRRRLQGLANSQAGSVVDYCALVERDEAALTKLKNFLTINVTEFFRDVEQFNILKTKVMPVLLNQRSHINVWSAGCSNGGEPYSVAITLKEITGDARHRIVATDIDDQVVDKARKGGPYVDADLTNVPPKLMLKYFQKEPDGYYIVDEIKRMVDFKRQDLLKNRFDSGFDMILCRNVVIYFSDEAKKKLYRGFYDSLNPNGVLFIGATETLLEAKEVGLERLYNCFYQKKFEEKPRLVQSKVVRV